MPVICVSAVSFYLSVKRRNIKKTSISFFNKQTPPHFFAVFYTRSRTTHKKHLEKRKKKIEKEIEEVESRRLGCFYGGIGRGVTRFVVFC